MKPATPIPSAGGPGQVGVTASPDADARELADRGASKAALSSPRRGWCGPTGLPQPTESEEEALSSKVWTKAPPGQAYQGEITEQISG